MDIYSSNSSLIQKLVTALLLGAAFLISAGGVIYLSLRGKEVKVPDLVGKSESDAERLLSAEGLRLKVRNRAMDEKTQANLISEQTPNAGITVKAGQVVSVAVSTGVDPDLAKKEEAKAEPKPSPKPTTKPKPKPSPSASPQSNKEKEATDKKAVDAATGKDKKDDKAATNKDLSKGDSKTVKATPTASPKTSPKPAAKPSPKKTDTN